MMTSTNMFMAGGSPQYPAYSPTQSGPGMTTSAAGGNSAQQVAQLLNAVGSLLAQVEQLMAASQGLGALSGGACGPANSGANAIGLMLMAKLMQTGKGSPLAGSDEGMATPFPPSMSCGGAATQPQPARSMPSAASPQTPKSAVCAPMPQACKPSTSSQAGGVQASNPGQTSSGPMDELDIKKALAGNLKPGTKLSQEDVLKLTRREPIEAMVGSDTGQVPPDLREAAMALVQKPKLYKRLLQSGAKGDSSEPSHALNIDSLGKESMIDIVNEKFNGRLTFGDAKKIAKGEEVKGRTPPKEITDKDGKKQPNPEFEEAKKHAQYMVDHPQMFAAAASGCKLAGGGKHNIDQAKKGEVPDGAVIGGGEISRSVWSRPPMPGELEALETIKENKELVLGKGKGRTFQDIAEDLKSGKFDQKPEVKKAVEFVLANDAVKDRADTGRDRGGNSDDFFSHQDLDARLVDLNKQKAEKHKPATGEHCAPVPPDCGPKEPQPPAAPPPVSSPPVVTPPATPPVSSEPKPPTSYLEAGQAFAKNVGILHALQQAGYADPNRAINYLDISSWDGALGAYGNRQNQQIAGIAIPPELRNAIRYFKDNPEEFKKFGKVSKDPNERNNLNYVSSFSDITSLPKPQSVK